MIKIRIEGTDINETFEYEGDGIVFALSHMEEDGLGVMAGVIGSFNKIGLKKVHKSIKGVLKTAYKEEGHDE